MKDTQLIDYYLEWMWSRIFDLCMCQNCLESAELDYLEQVDNGSDPRDVAESIVATITEIKTARWTAPLISESQPQSA